MVVFFLCFCLGCKKYPLVITGGNIISRMRASTLLRNKSAKAFYPYWFPSNLKNINSMGSFVVVVVNKNVFIIILLSTCVQYI